MHLASSSPMFTLVSTPMGTLLVVVAPPSSYIPTPFLSLIFNTHGSFIFKKYSLEEVAQIQVSLNGQWYHNAPHGEPIINSDKHH